MTDPALLLSFRSNLRACTSCDIHANTGGPIPWSGDPNPHYAVLGEAPGRTEALAGEPFVGDSGAILRHWLKEASIDPSKVAYLNSVACWPNRNPATPTKLEMSNCRGWMHGQLEFIRPKVLLTMGVVAFEQLRGTSRFPELKYLHGKPLRHPTYGFRVVHTYHPAAYLRGRSKRYEDMITADIAAMVEYDKTDWLPLDVCYICEDDIYRYDEWGMGMCYRHAAKQQMLFPDDLVEVKR